MLTYILQVLIVCFFYTFLGPVTIAGVSGLSLCPVLVNAMSQENNTWMNSVEFL